MTSPRSVQELDPSVALRSGLFDPAALLLLWCLRRMFFPLLWLGMILVTTGGRSDDITEAGGLAEYMTSFESAGEFFGVLLSPLVGLIVAFGLRIAVASLALALAYPLTRWNDPSDYAHGRRQRSRIRLWWDRWYLTRAYRSLRWTWAVRQVAAVRLGETGRLLTSCDPVLRWAGIALLVVYLVVASF